MNTKQWRKLGYKTIFRDGRVFLFRPLSEIVIHAEIAQGKWMDYDNVNQLPWTVVPSGFCGLPESLRKDFRRTVAACYCDAAGGIETCDFCSGARLAPQG